MKEAIMSGLGEDGCQVKTPISTLGYRQRQTMDYLDPKKHFTLEIKAGKIQKLKHVRAPAELAD